jgi:hypothetical protein
MMTVLVLTMSTRWLTAEQLWQGEPQCGWAEHMAAKRWVALDDFEAALQAAREYHSKSKADAW